MVVKGKATGDLKPEGGGVHHKHPLKIPYGTKFLWEFNFADWRFFVSCGN